ncbi:hypothetical protein [Lacisediminihabitans sp. H27-G8]
MIETNNIDDLIGVDDFGEDDTKVGTVGHVYVDAETQSCLG